MPKPFKIFSTRPMPPDAEIVTHEGTPHIRIRINSRTVLCKLTANGTTYLRPSKCWYFKVDGRRIKGLTDHKATQELAAKMQLQADRKRRGLACPTEEHVHRPLTDHLKDYASHLEAKGDSHEHIQLTVSRVLALLQGCGFVFPHDVDATRAANWLTALRRADQLPELPPQESYLPSDAAKLLGISGAA